MAMQYQLVAMATNWYTCLLSIYYHLVATLACISTASVL